MPEEGLGAAHSTKVRCPEMLHPATGWTEVGLVSVTTYAQAGLMAVIKDTPYVSNSSHRMKYTDA